MSTLVADDADEAMAILTSRDDVAAVFTDIDMPGSMDGLALAAIIRRRWPQIQVVVTSGQRPSKAAGLPDGVAFFQKPYDYSNLVNHFR